MQLTARAHSPVNFYTLLLILLLLLSNQPSPVFAKESGNMEILANIAYGPDHLQTMDVYRPLNARDATVIFMVHGGAWRTGDKASKAVVENKVNYWVTRGYIFISTNYRLLPDATVDKQVTDVAQALAYAQKEAPFWGGDPDKFILMGHSAGAHLVSVLAASPGIAEDQDAKRWLGTISIDSACFNVVSVMESRHLSLYDRAFGSNKIYWESLSPFFLLSRAQNPLLAICSTRRKDNPCRQAEQFQNKAMSMGMRVDVLKVNLSHRKTNMLLGKDPEYTTDVQEFIESLESGSH